MFVLRLCSSLAPVAMRATGRLPGSSSSVVTRSMHHAHLFTTRTGAAIG